MKKYLGEAKALTESFTDFKIESTLKLHFVESVTQLFAYECFNINEPTN